MDWEKKFNSIIRDTDANLEKVKSRVMLSQRAASAAGGPGSVAVSPAIAVPSLAELHATVQQQAAEIRRIAGLQRRHELEAEFVRAELVRIRRDVKKMAAAHPAAETESTPRHQSSEPLSTARDDVLRRVTQLEHRVASLQEQRNREKVSARPPGLGSSPLACVDDHFPAEVGDVPPARHMENGQLTDPLGFNLDDLALSDSDDH